MRSESSDVARYYERNTRAFLRRGQGAGVGAIHRAVWGEGVASRDEAFHYVHAQIRALAESTDARRILDLGCGTGAGLAFVLDDRKSSGFAITNSPAHASLARARLAGRADVACGDFCTGPLPEAVDLAYGIESFVHAPDTEAFFATVSGALAPGGRLVLCDDFLAGPATDPRVVDFQRGWRAGSLVSPAAADEIASRRGLACVDDRDWTSYLELDRPRDRLLALFMAIAGPGSGRSERLRSLYGGHALRLCLKAGLVTYRYRIWRKA